MAGVWECLFMDMAFPDSYQGVGKEMARCRQAHRVCLDLSSPCQMLAKGLVVMTITGILLFDVEKCQLLRFHRSFGGDLWHFWVAIAQKLGKICE